MAKAFPLFLMFEPAGYALFYLTANKGISMKYIIDNIEVSQASARGIISQRWEQRGLNVEEVQRLFDFAASKISFAEQYPTLVYSIDAACGALDRIGNELKNVEFNFDFTGPCGGQ